MKQDTQSKFAAILAAAQNKVNGTVKPLEAKISQVKEVVKELPKDEVKQPVITPELSNFTFDSLIADIQPEIVTIEAVKASLQIIDYSDKAIAVIGNTKQHKEQLKQLGGKFNMYLKCGAGWIFPKTKE